MAPAVRARVSALYARRLSTNPAIPHIAFPPLEDRGRITLSADEKKGGGSRASLALVSESDGYMTSPRRAKRRPTLRLTNMFRYGTNIRNERRVRQWRTAVQENGVPERI